MMSHINAKSEDWTAQEEGSEEKLQSSTGVMLRVERVLSAQEAYYVVWGGRRASRDFPVISQAYAVMWSILRVLFVESDIHFTPEAMASDLGFAKIMLQITEEVMKTEGLRAAFKEYLKEENQYWDNEVKILASQSSSEGEKKAEDAA